MNVTDRAYALELDKNDPLAHFKSQFVVTDPQMCYLDGNSLGRLPQETISAVNNLMSEWGAEVVTGWSHWVDEAQPTGDLLGQAALGAGSGQILVCDTTSRLMTKLIGLRRIRCANGYRSVQVGVRQNFVQGRRVYFWAARA